MPHNNDISLSTRPEKFAAAFSVASPIAFPAVAAFLDPSALFGLTLGAGAYVGMTSAAYGGHLSERLLGMLPGGDILHGHRNTLTLSAWLTAASLGSVVVGGPEQAEAVLAGFLDPASISGVLSMAWYSAWALLPIKLRSVLRGNRTLKGFPEATKALQAAQDPATGADIVRMMWDRFAFTPGSPARNHRIVVGNFHGPYDWDCTITAPVGVTVKAKAEMISSLYGVPVDQICTVPGTHAGEITFGVRSVSWSTQEVSADISDLKEYWSQRIGRSGGSFPGSRVREFEKRGIITAVAVEALPDVDSLPHPKIRDLAGALRRSPSLVAYEPTPGDPRSGLLYLMDENPLRRPHPLSGLEDVRLHPETGDFVLGHTVNGRKARVQLISDALGALHVGILGSTGSGKGGVLQLLALAGYASGSAIIYVDPKGSSNPTITKMAAFSGLADRAIEGLRVALAVLRQRKADSAVSGEKNFRARPGRPHILVIVDEAASCIGEAHPEGAEIAKEISREGRSLGMSLVIASQNFNASSVGSTTTRDQIVASGTVIVLRTTGSSLSVLGLPSAWQGIEPGELPVSWSTGIKTVGLFPTEEEEEASRVASGDRTYGLGYVSQSEGCPKMIRAWNMEDADPFLDGRPVTQIQDVSWWSDESAVERIAATPAQTGEKSKKSAKASGTGAEPPEGNFEADSILAGLLVEKPKTLRERVLDALDVCHSQAVDGPVEGFSVKDMMGADSGLASESVDSIRTELSKLVNKEPHLVRRMKQGLYALTDCVPE